MSWELVGKPKTYSPVTKKIAQEFAEMEAAHVDRPLSERRLSVYRRMVEEKMFRPVSWAKALCLETQQTFRVNGKHTSILFSSLPPEMLAGLTVVVEEYQCDTLEDVAKLYGTFDSQQQSRTASDVNRAFAAMIPELKELDQKAINLMVSALTLAENPSADSVGIRTQSERAEKLFDHIEECLWLSEIIGKNRQPKKGGHLWRVAVGAAMLATWRKNRKESSRFWLEVRDETGTKPEDASRKLAKYLTLVSADRGAHADKPKRLRANNREIYSKCLLGWNAWRKGVPTNLNYHANAKIPSAY